MGLAAGHRELTVAESNAVQEPVTAECTRCASLCARPRCGDDGIEVVIVVAPNYKLGEPAGSVIGRYRCRYGEFRDFPRTLDFPIEMPGGPLPPVAAFSWYHYDDRRRVRCRDVGGRAYIDVLHEGRAWTYRKAAAYTQLADVSGRIRRTPAGFDVGVLPD